MNVPVWPLHQAVAVRRIVVSTYQAVSGAGAWGMWELDEQIKAFAAGRPAAKKKFPHQIVNNLFSHNSAIADNGYNEEENKMVNETRKIFHCPELLVTATCVRVPVMRAHSEAINLQFTRPMSEAQVREILVARAGRQDRRRPQEQRLPHAPGRQPARTTSWSGASARTFPSRTAAASICSSAATRSARGPRQRRPDRREALVGRGFSPTIKSSY